MKVTETEVSVAETEVAKLAGIISTIASCIQLNASINYIDRKN